MLGDMAEITGAEALLLENLGTPFLSYVLNSDAHLVAARLSEGALLGDPREAILQELLRFLGLIAVAPDQNPFATSQSLGALGQFDARAGLGWSTARRAELGADVDIPPTDDPVAHELLPIARDLYPLFLLPQLPGLPVTYGLTTPPISQPLYQHPQRLAFEDAANRDPVLHRLFTEDDGTPERLLRLYRSTGIAGGLPSELFADGVLRVSWEAATRKRAMPFFQEFAEAVIAELRAIRTVLTEPETAIRAYIGLAGLRIPVGRSLDVPWGVIREISLEDESMIPPGLRGTLQTNTPDGTITIDYAGDCVLEMDVPYRVLLAAPHGPPDPWPLELVSTHAVEERLQIVRIALLLSSEREQIPIIVGTWRSFLDPLAIGARGSSWSDPRRLPTLSPIALTDGEVDAWGSWIALIDSASIEGIEIALRRTLLAAAERADPVDALVDTIIAWENLFGSRSGEPTLRISSSMAWLLGDDGLSRREIRREVGRLYSLRSDVVHGNRPLAPEEAVQGRSSALRLTVDALKRLISDRPELLDCRNGDERSNRLILDV